MKTDILLIPETKLTTPAFHARWSDEDLARVTTIAAGFPAAVADVSGGMCKIEQAVRVVGPLTTVSPYTTSWWPGPNDTRQWWSSGVQSVIVLWESDVDLPANDPGLTQYGGLGMGGNPTYATWAVPDGAESWWISKTFPQGAMVHEWGHGIEANAKSKGFTITSLHAAAEHGYTDADNWREWYRAYFSGKIPNSITSEVWQALGEPGMTTPTPEPVQTFKDVSPTHRHYRGIEYMAKVGVARPDANGNFSPDAPMNRGSMMTFMARLHQAITGE